MVSIVLGAGYHLLIEAFGGRGYAVVTSDELKSALSESFSIQMPAVINVTINLYTGAKLGGCSTKTMVSCSTVIHGLLTLVV